MKKLPLNGLPTWMILCHTPIESATIVTKTALQEILADLSDVYDPHRSDVENWQGLVIDEITELCNIVPELV